MTSTFLNFILASVGMSLIGCTGDTSARAAEPEANAVAVVELFTSEGCSSCPPADALLGKIMHDAQKDGRAIYPIAWHVDYWDRLGWRDPFSSADATARQNAYANAFHTDEIYTPQMIVNGQKGFVGSDEATAKSQIAAALSKAAPAHVTLHTQSAADHAITVAFAVENAPAGAVLNLVAVERGLSVRVARGENGGRTLDHENVVRAFQKQALDQSKTGTAKLTVPAGVEIRNVRVIAFVQDPASMQIVGAGTITP